MTKELNKNKSRILNKSKMSSARSTTALTCLVGVLLISAESANAVTATGQFAVASSIAAACTVSLPTMSFGVYNPANTITANSIITANCSSGTTFNISLLETPDASGTPKYYLTNETTGLSDASNRLEVTFTNQAAGAGSTMTNAAATITGTGTGTTATAGTISGRLASGQSGLAAGTYGRLMTLVITY